MNKRTFLRLSSATIAIPAVSRLLAWAAPDKLTNWAGNLEYSTENLYAAKSQEQIRDFVKNHPKFKVLGSRHCFNNIADSKDAFLSLKPLDEIVSLDAQARTVTVEPASPTASSPRSSTPKASRSTISLRSRTFPSPEPAPPRPMAPAKKTVT